jgi:hypothetical protein
MEKLYNWLFHYNHHTEKWTAFHRDDHSNYWNGTKTIHPTYVSTNVPELYQILTTL